MSKLALLLVGGGFHRKPVEVPVCVRVRAGELLMES